MNEDTNDALLDLLTKKAIYGLDEAEQMQLDALDAGTAEMEFRSLEITAAAISQAGLGSEEPLPTDLRSKILSDANAYIVDHNAKTQAWPPATDRVESAYESDAPERSASSWFGWFGWAAAAAACVVLALNLWFTRFPPTVEVARVPQPAGTPRVLTPAEKRDEMLGSTADVVRASWAPGNVKDIKQISGDIVWSDEKQAGYMRFRGLPVNDAAATCYQLWIFDKTQDKAKPIDGGIFDVTTEGEIIIPVDAKLAAQGAYMFAITIERHGGVVVSAREKIAATAKVENQPA